MINSTLVDPANIFAQAKLSLGLKGDKLKIMIGGGYATTPTSTEIDFDQISAHLDVGYATKTINYILRGVASIDPPLGLISSGIEQSEGLWVVSFGISGDI